MEIWATGCQHIGVMGESNHNNAVLPVTSVGRNSMANLVTFAKVIAEIYTLVSGP